MNDGKTLRPTIRGVEFSGPDFDSMSPVNGSIDLMGFTLNRGELCACLLAFDVPVPVIVQGSELSGVLCVQLELGAPAPNGGMSA